MFLKSFRCPLVLVGVLLVLAACLSARDTAYANGDRFAPSEMSAPFAAENYLDFANYVTQTQDGLSRNKIYFDPAEAQKELEAATPFELLPAEHCTSGQSIWPSRGILLVHGLSDMPFAMRDLAEAFVQRCFVVRAILLPGHGTRAGDLLQITRADWLNATRFGLDTLKANVDEVYVGGFSLGGLLATYAAAEDPEIHGVFAFSPALALERAWQLQQTVWLRYIIGWADRDEPDDFARYEAMPVNGLAETYLLTQDLEALLEVAPLPVPVFLAQSADDGIIDTETNAQYFQARFTSPFSRMVTYEQNPPHASETADPRIVYENSYLPEQRVVGFSHQSVHIAPTNTHYGPDGAYRNCGINSDRSEQEVERCLSADVLWRGEVVGGSEIQLEQDAAVVRLTFNPLFDRLLREIDGFLAAIEESEINAES